MKALPSIFLVAVTSANPHVLTWVSIQDDLFLNISEPLFVNSEWKMSPVNTTLTLTWRLAWPKRQNGVRKQIKQTVLRRDLVNELQYNVTQFDFLSSPLCLHLRVRLDILLRLLCQDLYIGRSTTVHNPLLCSHIMVELRCRHVSTG